MRQSKIFFFLLATAVSVTSCLKKDRMNIDQDLGPRNVIEFDNTGGNSAKVTSKFPGFYSDLGVLGTGESKTFDIKVSYSGADVAPEDITVKLEIDQSVLAKYNEDNKTTYAVPASDIISFPSTLVIKKGERMAIGQAKVTITNTYDYNAAYGLPLKIASASSGLISGNFGKAVYSFGVRNKYDGIYDVLSGAVTRYSAPGAPLGDALSGDISTNPDVTLTTVGATTVEISNLKWHGGGGMAGIDNLRATVDPATNLVTMFALGNASLKNWPGHENTYDPATKTFHLAFIWNPTSNVRTYEVVIKYKGAR
jgi:hypothetical protein